MRPSLLDKHYAQPAEGGWEVWRRTRTGDRRIAMGMSIPTAKLMVKLFNEAFEAAT